MKPFVPSSGTFEVYDLASKIVPLGYLLRYTRYVRKNIRKIHQRINSFNGNSQLPTSAKTFLAFNGFYQSEHPYPSCYACGLVLPRVLLLVNGEPSLLATHSAYSPHCPHLRRCPHLNEASSPTPVRYLNGRRCLIGSVKALKLKRKQTKQQQNPPVKLLKHYRYTEALPPKTSADQIITQITNLPKQLESSLCKWCNNTCCCSICGGCTSCCLCRYLKRPVPREFTKYLSESVDLQPDVIEANSLVTAALSMYFSESQYRDLADQDTISFILTMISSGTGYFREDNSLIKALHAFSFSSSVLSLTRRILRYFKVDFNKWKETVVAFFSSTVDIPFIDEEPNATIVGNSTVNIDPQMMLTITTSVVSLVACAALGMKDAKQLFNVSYSLKAFKEVKSSVKDFATFLLEDCFMLSLTDDAALLDRVMDMHKVVDEIVSMPHHKILTDAAILTKLTQLQEEIRKLSREVATSKSVTSQRIMSKIDRQASRISEVVKAIQGHMLLVPRQEPVGIILTGKPGVGKSTLCFAISVLLNERLGYTKGTYNLEKDEKGFYQPYSGQCVGTKNEFMNYRAEAEFSFLRIFNMLCSSDPFPMEGADLPYKTQHALHKAVIMTTNVTEFKWHTIMPKETAEAFLSRNIIVEVIDPLCEGRSGLNTHRTPGSYDHLTFNVQTTVPDKDGNTKLRRSQLMTWKGFGDLICQQTALKEINHLKFLAASKDVTEADTLEINKRIDQLNRFSSGTHLDMLSERIVASSHSVFNAPPETQDNPSSEENEVEDMNEIAGAAGSVSSPSLASTPLSSDISFGRGASQLPSEAGSNDTITSNSAGIDLLTIRLQGPPGVGKTHFAHNIKEALEKSYRFKDGAEVLIWDDKPEISREYHEWYNSLSKESVVIICSNTVYQKQFSITNWACSLPSKALGIRSDLRERKIRAVPGVPTGIARRIGLSGKVRYGNEGVDNPETQVTIDMVENNLLVNGSMLKDSEALNFVVRMYEFARSKSRGIVEYRNTIFPGPYEVEIISPSPEDFCRDLKPSNILKVMSGVTKTKVKLSEKAWGSSLVNVNPERWTFEQSTVEYSDVLRYLRQFVNNGMDLTARLEIGQQIYTYVDNKLGTVNLNECEGILTNDKFLLRDEEYDSVSLTKVHLGIDELPREIPYGVLIAFEKLYAFSDYKEDLRRRAIRSQTRYNLSKLYTTKQIVSWTTIALGVSGIALGLFSLIKCFAPSVKKENILPNSEDDLTNRQKKLFRQYKRTVFARERELMNAPDETSHDLVLAKYSPIGVELYQEANNLGMIGRIKEWNEQHTNGIRPNSADFPLLHNYLPLEIDIKAGALWGDFMYLLFDYVFAVGATKTEEEYLKVQCKYLEIFKAFKEIYAEQGRLIEFFNMLGHVDYMVDDGQHTVATDTAILPPMNPARIARCRGGHCSDPDHNFKGTEACANAHELEIPKLRAKDYKKAIITPNSLHPHICVYCGNQYLHKHRYQFPNHKQYVYQCPYPECTMYFKKGSEEQQKNLTESVILPNMSSLDVFNGETHVQQFVQKLKKNYGIVKVGHRSNYALITHGCVGVTVAHLIPTSESNLIFVSEGVAYNAMVISRLPGRDVAFFKITDKQFQPRADLRRYFRDDYDQEFDAVYVRFGYETTSITSLGIKVYDTGCPDRSFSADFNTGMMRSTDFVGRLTGNVIKEGDCGLPILQVNKTECRIMGIHNGYTSNSQVFYGTVLQASWIPTDSILSNSTDIGVVKYPHRLDNYTSVEWLGLEVPQTSMVNVSNKIVNVRLEDSLFPLTKLPTLVNANEIKASDAVKFLDKHGNPDPMINQIVKFYEPVVESAELSNHHYEVARELMVTYWRQRYVPKVLPKKDVLSGNEYLNGICMTSSCGPSLKKHHPSARKVDIFTVDEITGERKWKKTPAAIFVQEQYKRVSDKYNKCKNFLVLAHDVPKVEVLPKEKVMEGKCRLFSVLDLAVNIFLREIFGDALAYLNAQHRELPYAIGHNPYNFGTTIVARHKQHTMENDFQALDKTVGLFFYILMCELFSPGNEKQDVVLAQSLCNSIHVWQGILYLTNRGNDSGSTVTTLLNCVTLDYEMTLAYVDAFFTLNERYPSNVEFEQQCVKTIQGDDGILSTPFPISFERRRKLARSLGLKLTPAKDKIDNHITFCSRSFQRINGYVYGVLKKESIIGMLHYCKNGKFKENQAANCNTALYEAAVHSDAFFKKVTQEVYNIVRKYALHGMVNVLLKEEYMTMHRNESISAKVSISDIISTNGTKDNKMEDIVSARANVFNNLVQSQNLNVNTFNTVRYVIVNSSSTAVNTTKMTVTNEAHEIIFEDEVQSRSRKINEDHLRERFLHKYNMRSLSGLDPIIPNSSNTVIAEPATVGYAARAQNEATIPVAANPQPTAQTPAMTHSGDDITAAVEVVDQMTLNPIGAPNMLSVGAVSAKIEDIIYGQILDADVEIQVPDDAPSGTIIAQIPYAAVSDYTNNYIKAYANLHERYSGALVFRFTVVGNPLFSGAIGAAWMPRRIPTSTYAISELMKFSYTAKGVTMPFNTVHLLHDARKDNFYREVSDDSGNLDDRPHLVLFLMMSIVNPLREGVITRIRIGSRLATPADGNAFMFTLPKLPDAASSIITRNTPLLDIMPHYEEQDVFISLDGLYQVPYTNTKEFSYKQSPGPNGGLPQVTPSPLFQHQVCITSGGRPTVAADEVFRTYYPAWSTSSPDTFGTQFGIPMLRINSNIQLDVLTRFWNGLTLGRTGNATREEFPPILFVILRNPAAWAMPEGVRLLSFYTYTYRKTTEYLNVPNDPNNQTGYVHLLDQKITAILNIGQVEIIFEGVMNKNPASSQPEMLLNALNAGYPINYLTAEKGVPTINTEPVLGIPYPQFISSNFPRLPTGFVAIRVGNNQPAPVLFSGISRQDSTYFGDTVWNTWARRRTPEGRTIELALVDRQLGRSVAVMRYARNLDTFYVESQYGSLYKYIKYSPENLYLQYRGFVEPGTAMEITNTLTWDDRLVSNPITSDTIIPNAFAGMMAAQAVAGAAGGIGSAFSDRVNRRHQEKLQSNQFAHSENMLHSMNEHSLNFQNISQEFQRGILDIHQAHDIQMSERSHRQQMDLDNSRMQNTMMLRGLGFGQGR